MIKRLFRCTTHDMLQRLESICMFYALFVINFVRVQDQLRWAEASLRGVTAVTLCELARSDQCHDLFFETTLLKSSFRGKPAQSLNGKRITAVTA